MPFFFTLVVAAWVLFHAYLGWRLVGPSPLKRRGRAVAWACIAALAVGAVVILISSRRTEGPAWLLGLEETVFLYMGCLLLVLPLTLLRDFLACLALAANAIYRLRARSGARAGFLPADRALRRAWLCRSGMAVLASSLVLTAAGFWQACQPPRITRVQIPIADLPAEFEGFRIVHLTDTHVGSTTRRGFLADVAAQVNGLEPDAVAVTGDLADGSVDGLREEVAPLGAMRARDGVYFTPGNHEYFWDYDGWMKEIERLGVKVLVNRHAVIRRGNASLLLAGVGDYSQTRPSDPAAAMAGAPACEVKVLLAHEPKTAVGRGDVPGAADAGYDLMLCGHTHGGQFWPWNLLVGAVQPYLAGEYRRNRMWIYVSRGAGYWGPPNRLGIPLEIAEITLVRAPARPPGD
jgi:uncharacterized protein